MALLLNNPFPTTDFIGQVKEKTVVIWAEQDTTVPVTNTRRLVEKVSQLEMLMVLPNSSHRVRLDKDFPPTLNKALSKLGL